MTPSDYKIILGNSNKRFSGVTSTMLQILNIQKRHESIAVLGKHYVPTDVKVIGFIELAKLSRTPLPDGSYRIFHARRNNEMIQALILKYIFRCRLKIVFTSTAQRKKTWITRWLMSKMDGLISTCQAAANFMPSKPDVIIPHGVNSDIYHPDLKLPEDIKLPGHFNIGIFGRVRAQKGVDLLIDAAINLLPDNPQWGIVIVGEITSEQQQFKVQLEKNLADKQLIDRVLFTGKLKFEQLPAMFANVDIVTALSRNEGFGLTVLEAMSCAKAVVASYAGAWPDIISDGENAFLTDLNQPNDLFAKLQKIMNNQGLREQLGHNAREKILQEYQIEHEARRLLEFYNKLSL